MDGLVFPSLSGHHTVPRKSRFLDVPSTHWIVYWCAAAYIKSVHDSDMMMGTDYNNEAQTERDS
jgi:hypothetical protein